MCETCGCSDGAQVTLVAEDGVELQLMLDGSTVRHPLGGKKKKLAAPVTHEETLALKVLEKNDQLAGRNRGWLAAQEVLALNLMSSPGAGKTALLERTLRELDAPMTVLEGDQATTRDADRIRATGTRVVQINTGKGCHLESDMIWHGLGEVKPDPRSVLFIENVGNLVCPALFDLGEDARVVLLTVTEGEDKPLKYPHMFRAADLVLLTKVDLLPYLEFDVVAAREAVRDVAPSAEWLPISSKTGEGMAEWYRWVQERRAAKRPG